ncbi:MAG TPA: DUF2905 domain-containing protein [Syntrophaceae bacterium]|nr:DUF2905 domain-containing protein [Syntrophaceae bacterium]
MNPLAELGKMLIVIGVIIAILGLFISIGPNIPLIGKLPGDIYIKKKGFGFYFPITTCIVISIILTLLFSLFRK